MAWVRTSAAAVRFMGKGALLLPELWIMRKRGVRAFRKSLEETGIQRETAERLADMYSRMVDPFELARNLRK